MRTLRTWLVVIGTVLSVGAGLTAVLTGASAATEPGRHFVYTQPSIAMQPTIHTGDRVSVDGSAYATHPPSVGDVVLVHPPLGAEQNEGGCGQAVPPVEICPVAIARDDPQTRFILRVVGGPGDRIALRKGHVIRNGALAREPFATSCIAQGCAFPRPVSIPRGHYLTVGDNRGESYDGRFWGAIPKTWVVGRVVRDLGP